MVSSSILQVCWYVFEYISFVIRIIFHQLINSIGTSIESWFVQATDQEDFFLFFTYARRCRDHRLSTKRDSQCCVIWNQVLESESHHKSIK
eukprot:08664.XXX_144596_144868_1 [CDS] Oithona nana genome sequencing.